MEKSTRMVTVYRKGSTTVDTMDVETLIVYGRLWVPLFGALVHLVLVTTSTPPFSHMANVTPVVDHTDYTRVTYDATFFHSFVTPPSLSDGSKKNRVKYSMQSIDDEPGRFWEVLIPIEKIRSLDAWTEAEGRKDGGEERAYRTGGNLLPFGKTRLGFSQGDVVK
ncbi:hypothetical protein RUM43_001716 [Polyplax serrata]|uniref:Uncharacterized protein n=1 Tax=Polyplax serrata TaxID=468196 RepID=A0AAN8SFW2_POLSC